MRILSQIVIGLFCMPLLLNAQEEKQAEKFGMVELTFMHAKKGMNKKFEDAVKAHNSKFHPEGPYQSNLWIIETGAEAGTYVWTMGGLTYTDLDGAPGEGAHGDDWTKNVEPYVESYGRVEYWKLADDLSTPDDKQESMQTVWLMDVKWTEYYRFREFMQKVHAINAAKGEEIHVWMNEFTQDDGRDVAITWPFDNWAELDDEGFNMMEAYEEEHGPGSWMNAMKEWSAFNAKMVREIWRQL